MKRIKILIPIVLAIVVAFGSVAFASTNVVGMPSMSVNGSTVTCKAKAVFPSQSIDAILELYQGGALVDSWHKTGTGLVTFNENTTFTSGQTYTLTISGTVDGVEFTPASVTRTLW